MVLHTSTVNNIEGIIGGTPTVLYLFFVEVRTDFWRFCGGTIIGPNLVVTAAKCLFNPRWKKWAYHKKVTVLKDDFTRSPNRRDPPNGIGHAENCTCVKYQSLELLPLISRASEELLTECV